MKYPTLKRRRWRRIRIVLTFKRKLLPLKKHGKNTSQSLFNSKTKQIVTYETEYAKKSEASADFGKKIADKRKKRADAYLKLQKAQQDEQKQQDNSNCLRNSDYRTATER